MRMRAAVIAAFIVLSCGIAQRNSFASAQLTNFSVNSTAASAHLATAPASIYDTIFYTGFENQCTEDSDRDGLANCVETNTHVYKSVSNTGTDPRNPDTDGDGITDGDEVLGTAGGLNLPALGVKPLHKDILIEYDWFDDASGCTQHSHRPPPTVIQNIHDFFANATRIINPDGTTGINVIQDYGQGGVFSGGNRINDPANPDAIVDALGSQYEAYEASNFAANRRGYFHYVILSDLVNYLGLPQQLGVGNYFGFEMEYANGCGAAIAVTPVPEVARAALVHELGHNLGLHHGGDGPCNYKPNYNSIMNYLYGPNGGIDTNCNAVADGYTLGFSNGDRRTLDENNLNETQGVCIQPVVAIDWNNDLKYSTSVQMDVNQYGSEALDCGGTYTVLHDFDDWANLELRAVTPIYFQSPMHAPQTEHNIYDPLP